MDISYEVLRTVVIVALWIFGFLFLVGLGIIIFLFGRVSVRNNSDKAAIFINSGDKLNPPITGTLHKRTKEGTAYRYKGDKFVIVPHSYTHSYYAGKVAVFLGRVGQLVSTPFNKWERISESEKETLIYKILESHVGADAVNAISGKKKIPNFILFILIFIVVLIVGTVGIKFVQQQQAQQQAQQTQQTQQQPTQPTQPEYKIEVK